MMRMLVISNDYTLAGVLRMEFGKHYKVQRISKEDAMKQAVESRTAALCIVDSDKQGMGIKVIRKVKRNPLLPVLFLSKKGTKSQKIEEKKLPLSDEVDRYLEEPYTRDEMIESVSVLLKQRAQRQKQILELSEKIKVYPEIRKVYCMGQEVVLTHKEFDILYYLMSQNGKAVSYKELYEAVWEEEYIKDDDNIMGHVHRLRAKLESDSKRPRFIENVFGVGYRFMAERKSGE